MSHATRLVSMLTVAMVAAYLADSADAKRGCASFGHSCFGGHGKRSEAAAANSESLLPLDPVDYQTLDVFRQFCSLQPDQYLRLAPVFRKLVTTLAAEEEPLPRK